MHLLRPCALLACLALFASAVAFDEYGHSRNGSAFDSGMRTKPWVMPGIGKTHFPITSKNPEVQKWFDQGNSLLHSFWFEEAERSFRWCLKLDPDCTMAYWGLARCGFNWFSIGSGAFGKEDERYVKFLKEAVKRKSSVTPRERRYIEAWEESFAPEGRDRSKTIVRLLQEIVLAYPDDVEAKAQLAFFNIGQGSAYANELIIQEVLKQNPMHPGAHHASIHNWDGGAAVQAINSCALYGKAAPGIGHSLHMPGHIYSKIGMWHEAARAMDAATRTELKYMNERLALPFETWNYSHNRNYLCYIQEQLGMASASIQGAKDLLASPMDPDYSPEGRGVASEGLYALSRALVKFERWDEILTPGLLPWNEKSSEDQLERALTRTLALTGKGSLKEAREELVKLRALHAKNSRDQLNSMLVDAAEGLVLAAEGKHPEAVKMLKDAATTEEKLRSGHRYPNDPSDIPWPVMRLLGDEYLRMGDKESAVDAYKRALRAEVNDGFSLAGLARAYHALGKKEEAERYYGRLLYVWSNADPDLRWMREARVLGIQAKPVAETPAKERPYRPAELNRYGPSNWQPYSAPKLECTDSDGKTVRLEDYRGKNVLLVFYLSDACVHCVEQLVGINKRMADLEKGQTVVLAVSSATPAANKASLKVGQLGIRLLSDRNHENARRYASYDDFEDMELHSTILIDGQGRVRWKRTGGNPFTNVDFVLKEVGRINSADPKP